MQAETDYESMPGYVDLTDLGLPKDIESTTDVFIKKPLLKLVSLAVKTSAKKDEDREFAEILSQLSLVQVRVFEDMDDRLPEIAKRMNALQEEFEKDDWELIAKVRDKDENVRVYYKLKDEKIEGLVVTVIDDKDEAVFVNVVGHFALEDLGKLGKKIDLGLKKDFDWSKVDKIDKQS